MTNNGESQAMEITDDGELQAMRMTYNGEWQTVENDRPLVKKRPHEWQITATEHGLKTIAFKDNRKLEMINNGE